MLPRLATAVLAWSLVALMLSAHAAAAERRVALVLGNSAYSAPGLELVNPRYDAEDVAAALKALDFDVLVVPDADKETTNRAIETFARMAAGADAALFYYAGHALQHEGRNYLLPVDADVRDEIGLEFATISVETIRKLLERSGGIKIMVLDACRNNPVAGRLSSLPPGATFASRGERTRGIERLDKGQGLIVAYAAAPDAVALDGQGRNSPYTSAFLRRLAEAGLEIETMFRRIAADVDAATEGRQRPETYVSMIGEYYLNQNDRIAWDKIKGSEDPATLRDFLERFPSSYYALEARYRLLALERAISSEKQRREDEKVAAAKHACEADRARLAAVADDDAAGLEAIAATATCAEARREAGRRIDAAEAAHARKAELCRREEAELRAVAQGSSLDEIAGLRGRATCPATLAMLDRKAVELAAAAEAACVRERVALGRIGPRDLAGLRDLGQKGSCPQVKAEAARRGEELEAKLAQEAERCNRDEAEWRGLSASGDRSAIETLRRRVGCDKVVAAIESRLAELQVACHRDEAGLAAIGARDLESLRAFAGRAICEEVKGKASQRLAALESTFAAENEACRRDAEVLARIDASDADGLRRFLGSVACDAAKAEGRQRLAALEGKLATEKEACRREAAALARIGSRDADGLRGFVGSASCDEAKGKASQRLATLEGTLAAEQEACRRDSEALARIATSDADGLRRFVGSAACDAAKAEGRQRLAALEGAVAAQKEACRRETDALARIGSRDADGLRGFVGTVSCDEVKGKAAQRLAALESTFAAEKEACRRDEEAWAGLSQSADRAEAELLRKRVACPAVVAKIDAALASLPTPPKPKPANTEALIRDAQAELGRLGCFEGRPNGKINTRTETGLNRYLVTKGAAPVSRDEIEITDLLVAELRQQDKALCATPAVAKPEPEPETPGSKEKAKRIVRLPPRQDAPEPKHVREKPARPSSVAQEAPSRQAPAPSARPPRQPSAPVAVGGASGGGRGSSAVTGVGF